MMIRFQKPKPGRIAVVFSGGGAKGVYSAGVSKALVECGIKPDIITGSSVGAMNAAILAETYLQWPRSEVEALWRKDELERQIEFWEHMTADIDGRKVKAASSSTLTPVVLEIMSLAAALGLTLVGLVPSVALPWISIPAGIISLGLTAKLGYWWFIEPLTKPNSYTLVKKIYYQNKLLNGYLLLHGFGRSIFSNSNLERILARFIPPDRNFAQYRQVGIDLKITRTNIRTGYKEVAEYLEQEKPKRIMGNPLVLPSVLASGAFPGAFPPVKLSKIYDRENNQAFWQIMKQLEVLRRKLGQLWGEGWEEEYIRLLEFMDLWSLRRQEEGEEIEELNETQTKKLLGDYVNFIGKVEIIQPMTDFLLEVLPDLWKYRYYPIVDNNEGGEDEYFDGGVADNTPISLALNGLKDLLTEGKAHEDEEHIILVVMLSRPKRNILKSDQLAKLNAVDIGLRGLNMLGLDDKVEDMENANRITRLLKEIPKGKANRVLANILTVYPDEPLPWVLAFDRRLGFRPGHNGKYIAMGCRNTLEALLEARERGLLTPQVNEKLASIADPKTGGFRCHNKTCPYYEKECRR
ncbi:MAG: patatin-like phospholipase family protein [Clostridia bacterium]|nr:patatin-like phospholipase family protein [Clostridia bacterium]